MMLKKLLSVLPLLVTVSAQGWGQESEPLPLTASTTSSTSGSWGQASEGAEPLPLVITVTPPVEEEVPEVAEVVEEAEIVEEAPVVPVEEAPVEEAPVEEAPVEEAPVEEVSVEEVPVDEVSEVDTTTKEVPVVEDAEEETTTEIEEEAPVDEASKTSLPLLEFTIELKEGSFAFVEDLGLATYMYDKMKPVLPGLKSITLELKDYVPETTVVHYAGEAKFDDFTVVVPEYNELFGIAVPSLFANETIVDAEPETTQMTAATVHEMQKKILDDYPSVESYWDEQGKAIGENLRISSLKFDDDALFAKNNFSREPWVIAIACASAAIVFGMMIVCYNRN